MDMQGIFNNLFEKKAGADASESEATATKDPASEKTAGMSKLAEDSETLYAAGQIMGMGYVHGAIKEAAEVAGSGGGSADDKIESGVDSRGGDGSIHSSTHIPAADSPGPKPGAESSVKHITKTNPTTSGTSPDDVGDGEATEGGANGKPHPGIQNSLKSKKDSFAAEVQ